MLINITQNSALLISTQESLKHTLRPTEGP
jgi:hypothetical protein